MEAEQQNGPVKNQGSNRRIQFLRTAAAVMAGVLIFTIGVGVGAGHIHVGGASSNVSQVGNWPNSLDYASVNKVYDTLKADYDGQLTEQQLLDGLKEGLAAATGDPHTEYFTAKEAQQFSNQLNNTFTGIGAELTSDSQGNIVVMTPLSGQPAAKAGLKAKDIITQVDGTKTDGMALNQVVDRIHGKAGTTVKLTVVRDKSRVLTFSIVRQNIQLPSVTSKILDGNIGYAQISTFGDDTATLMQKAADKFTAAHVKGIILDLRNNPGGRLDAAVQISSLWLPEGKTIVQEKRGGTVLDTYTSTGNHELHGIKTIVLVNGGSASASEITTAALHDNGAATVMGEQSYGKGSVQQVENFSDGSELKVTVARWYRPNGTNVDGAGITPDKVVTLSDQDAKTGNDVQLKAAEAFFQ